MENLLKKGTRLRILNLCKRNQYDNSSEFKDGQSTIGLLKEDFDSYCTAIQIGNFHTDVVLLIQETEDGRLIVNTESYNFLVEKI